MAYADLDDINAHLPTDKLEATDGNEEIDRIQVYVERLIRGRLAGTYAPATLAGWATPDDTPELIRSVAGMLVAALWYRLRYSEDQTDIPEYAQALYNDAMAHLIGIIDGSIELPEVTSDHTGRVPNSLYFWPNDDGPAPMFTVGMEF